MLSELRVRDFALIDRLTLTLGPGLNAVTGETGSGKSLLVTALELLAGARPRGGAATWVRAGAERAVVEARFALPTEGGAVARAVEAWFERHLPELAGAAWREEGELLCVRVLDARGRSRARVQGSGVTVAALGELLDHLLEVNAQFVQRGVRDAGRQLAWFDEIAAVAEVAALDGDGAPERIAAARAAYREVRAAWLDERARREALLARAHEREARATFLRLAREELERLEPAAGEASELRRERELLRQSEHVVGELGRAAGELSEGDAPVLARVAGVVDRVAAWSRAAPTLQVVAAELASGLVHLEEAAARLVSYLGGVEADPARLEAVEARLAELERVARRHGVDADELAALGEGLAREADELEDLDAELERAQRRTETALAAVRAAADALAGARRRAAPALARVLRPLLDRLGLADAELTARFVPRGAHDDAAGGGSAAVADEVRRFGPGGSEDVELLWRPNPGEPRRPLALIASGGEAARVFLALRCAAAGADPDARRTLVFDEVDAAVGGRLAPKVADCLAELAGGGQVVTVTHQPAIAARADRHLLVTKRTRQGRTRSVAVALEGRERLVEVAAMLGGSSRSVAARAEAERLLGRPPRDAPRGAGRAPGVAGAAAGRRAARRSA